MKFVRSNLRSLVYRPIFVAICSVCARCSGPHLKVTSPEYQINNRWIEAKFLGSVCASFGPSSAKTSPIHQIDKRLIGFSSWKHDIMKFVRSNLRSLVYRPIFVAICSVCARFGPSSAKTSPIHQIDKRLIVFSSWKHDIMKFVRSNLRSGCNFHVAICGRPTSVPHFLQIIKVDKNPLFTYASVHNFNCQSLPGNELKFHSLPFQ